VKESKRSIKKRVLAEAMAVYRRRHIPVRGVVLSAPDGKTLDTLKRTYHASPFSGLDELLHQCARLDGDVK